MKTVKTAFVIKARTPGGHCPTPSFHKFRHPKIFLLLALKKVYFNVPAAWELQNFLALKRETYKTPFYRMRAQKKHSFCCFTWF